MSPQLSRLSSRSPRSRFQFRHSRLRLESCSLGCQESLPWCHWSPGGMASQQQSALHVLALPWAKLLVSVRPTTGTPVKYVGAGAVFSEAEMATDSELDEEWEWCDESSTAWTWGLPFPPFPEPLSLLGFGQCVEMCPTSPQFQHSTRFSNLSLCTFRKPSRAGGGRFLRRWSP